MNKHLVIFEPSGLKISVDSSKTILDAAREVGLHILADCGGIGSCGKCKIIVQPPSMPTERDAQHIQSEELQQGFRLACQHVVEEPIRVLVPYQLEDVKILSEGVSRKWDIDKYQEGHYGIAFDLGTTTIAAYLMDLVNGVQIAQISSLNPQTAFGEDVMSRIAYAIRQEDGIHLLRNTILKEINRLVMVLYETADLDPSALTRISVVGNTAMNHLFLGTEVRPLAFAPYTPTVKEAVTMRGVDINLNINPNCEVYVAPNIAGFVGGDTVAFILSQQLDSVKDVVLGIDIGTNGEIVLATDGQLFCCSAAAGPAFEGATIFQGMRGQNGAIEHFQIHGIDDIPEISVIGNANPQGICGSAIIDIVAELRRIRILDQNGRMQKVSKRVIEDADHGLSYVVVDSEEAKEEKRIIFTQRDVRQIQLAKAAIQAGTMLLLKSLEISRGDIARVLLAGAFGNYINPISATAIGLLPQIDVSKIVPVGNAAGEGAKGLLLSSESRRHADHIIESVHYIELASHSDFQKTFIESIKLP
ncbi:MAG: DUF4445 domain-containing protein [Candidatus Thorarchaeota archaeon]|nr:DUF4445 domain-containing protein [Candidatus Thorarchaeota archaeon]